MSCYSNKHMRLALLCVIHEFEGSNKCQVSLVVKNNCKGLYRKKFFSVNL